MRLEPRIVEPCRTCGRVIDVTRVRTLHGVTARWICDPCIHKGDPFTRRALIKERVVARAKEAKP